MLVRNIQLHTGMALPSVSARARIYLLIFVLLLAVCNCIYLWQLHMTYVRRQTESPFDHLSSTLLKPYYTFKCPRLSDDAVFNCSLPKIFMISARPDAARRPAQMSWKDEDIELIDTKEISRLITDNSVCSKRTWSNRLFSIYQRVFRDILKKHSHDEGFIFIEDDILLLDSKSFRAEACMAQNSKLQFYSFYKPTSQQSCLYHHGTLCFYVNREFLEHLAMSVPVRELCRLPVDIYLASTGPWFSTLKMIVKHNATERFFGIQLK